MLHVHSVKGVTHRSLPINGRAIYSAYFVSLLKDSVPVLNPRIDTIPPLVLALESCYDLQAYLLL